MAFNKCFNCNSKDIKQITVCEEADLPSLNLMVDRQKISTTFEKILQHLNVRVDQRSVTLCQECIHPMMNFCKYKKSFFKLTKPEALLSTFINKNHGGIQSEVKEEEGSERTTLDFQQDLKPTTVDVDQEFILPDHTSQTNDTFQSDNLPKHSSHSSDTIIEYKEQFIKLEIEKLSQRVIMEFSRCYKTCLKNDYASPKSDLQFYQCSKCDRKFSDTIQLETHQNSVHIPIRQNFDCKFCFRRFSLAWFLKNHLKFSHNEIEIFHFCKLCSNKFYNQLDLDDHILKKHDIRKYPYKCSNCLESFHVIAELRDHLITAHKGTKEADAAGGNILATEEYKAKKTLCSICDTTFFNSKILNKHKVSEHGQEDIVNCHICHKDFGSYSNLKDHRKLHTTCPTCDKAFPNYFRMNIHYDRVHTPFSERPFGCEICGQKHPTIFLLKNHYNWHAATSGPKKHYCNICSKVFQLKGHLMQHIRQSHSEKNKKHHCPFCKDVFATKGNLNFHMGQKHKDCLKFPCNICGRKFLGLGSVSSHMKIHTQRMEFKNRTEEALKIDIDKIKGEKLEVMSCYSSETFLFKCPYCGKSSDSQTHFFRHLRLVHCVKGYADPHAKVSSTINCLICEKSFGRKDLLDKHRRRIHKVTIKTSSAEPISQTFDCPHCKKTFTHCSYTVFMAHVQRHVIFVVENIKMASMTTKELGEFYDEQEKHFRCGCERTFPIQSQFLDHLTKTKAHSNVKIIYDDMKKSKMPMPFKCNQCPGMAYPTFAQFKKHKESHRFRKDRMCKCTVCDELLRSPKYLKIHMKLH